MDPEALEDLKSKIDDTAISLWRKGKVWGILKAYLMGKGMLESILDENEGEVIETVVLKNLQASGRVTQSPSNAQYPPVPNFLPVLSALPKGSSSSESEPGGNDTDPSSVSHGETLHLEGPFITIDITPSGQSERQLDKSVGFGMAKDCNKTEHLISQDYLASRGIPVIKREVKLRWCAFKSELFRLTTFVVVPQDQIVVGDVTFGQNWHKDESANLNKRKRDLEDNADASASQTSQKQRFDAETCERLEYQVQAAVDAAAKVAFEYSGRAYDRRHLGNNKISLLMRELSVGDAGIRNGDAGTGNDHG